MLVVLLYVIYVYTYIYMVQVYYIDKSCLRNTTSQVTQAQHDNKNTPWFGAWFFSLTHRTSKSLDLTGRFRRKIFMQIEAVCKWWSCQKTFCKSANSNASCRYWMKYQFLLLEWIKLSNGLRTQKQSIYKTYWKNPTAIFDSWVFLVLWKIPNSFVSWSTLQSIHVHRVVCDFMICFIIL